MRGYSHDTILGEAIGTNNSLFKTRVIKEHEVQCWPSDRIQPTRGGCWRTSNTQTDRNNNNTMNTKTMTQS